MTVHFPANILFETSAAFGAGPIVVPGAAVSARWRLPTVAHNGKRLPLVVELVADQTQFIEVSALYTHATGQLSWTAADVTDGTSGPGVLVTFSGGAKRIASIPRAFDLNELVAIGIGRSGVASYSDTSPAVSVDGAFVHRLLSATADRTITITARGVGDRVIIVNDSGYLFTLNPGGLAGDYRSMFLAEWTGSAWASIYSDARPPGRFTGGDFANSDLVSLAAANYTLSLDDGPFLSFHSQPDGTRKVFRPTASHGLFILQNFDSQFPINFDDGTPAVPGNLSEIPPRRARIVYWTGSAWAVGVTFGEGDSSAQVLSAAVAQAGYTVLRTSSRITVRLNEDLSAPATTTSPSNPQEGDEVDYIRHAGGFHPWTIDGSIILLGRDDRVTLRWFDGQWIEIYPPRDDVVFRRGTGGNSNHYDTDTIQAFTAAGTYTLQDPQGQSTNFEVILLQVGGTSGTGLVTLAFQGGSVLTQVPAGGPLVTNGPGTALRVKAIGSNQVWVRRVIVDPGAGAGAGDAAPSIAEFEASGPLTSSHLASKNVDVHAGTNSIDFDVPVNIEGRYIINAFDEDTGAAYHSCTVSVVGSAGSVNGSAGALGVREIVAGGVAVVSVIDPAGNAPIVKVTGDIFEPPPVRGAQAATKDDHRKVIEITGTQTFGAASGFPSGFVAVYIASGANRTLNGPGATDFEILDGGSAAVRKLVDGRLVASGAGNGYGTKVLS